MTKILITLALTEVQRHVYKRFDWALLGALAAQ